MKEKGLSELLEASRIIIMEIDSDACHSFLSILPFTRLKVRDAGFLVCVCDEALVLLDDGSRQFMGCFLPKAAASFKDYLEKSDIRELLACFGF